MKFSKNKNKVRGTVSYILGSEYMSNGYGAIGSETRIYLYCLYWLFGTHSLWMDTLLSLDIVGRSLDLPQKNVLDFIDFIPEALPSEEWMWVRGVESVAGGSGV